MYEELNSYMTFFVSCDRIIGNKDYLYFELSSKAVQL